MSFIDSIIDATMDELPDGVANIDVDDCDDPQAVSEYVRDVFKYVMSIEVRNATSFSSDRELNMPLYR